MLGAGKSKEWSIPNNIMQSSNNVKVAWLQGFFDDESHVSIKNKRIILNIVNQNGLKQIQTILHDLEIESNIRGPYFYKKFYSYHLSIYRNNIIRYANAIGFIHPKKIIQLLELVNTIKIRESGDTGNSLSKGFP